MGISGGNTASMTSAWHMRNPFAYPSSSGIRTKQFKYIEYQNDKRPREIFDLQADPGEKENIINTERGRALEKALKQELERLKKETGYRFVSRGYLLGLPVANQSLFNSIARMMRAANQATPYPQTQCSIVFPF